MAINESSERRFEEDIESSFLSNGGYRKGSDIYDPELGVFSNMTLVKSFVFSMLLTLIVIYVPFLEPIFDTVDLGLIHWIFVVILAFIPFIAGEIHKIRIRNK